MYLVRVDGRELGSFTEEQVFDLVEQGQIDGGAEVFDDELPQHGWLPLERHFPDILELVAKSRLRGTRGPIPASCICLDCKTIAEPRVKPRGSGLLEVISWLLCLVPGLVYSIWRRSAKQAVCASCGGRVARTDHPIGASLCEQAGYVVDWDTVKRPQRTSSGGDDEGGLDPLDFFDPEEVVDFDD